MALFLALSELLVDWMLNLSGYRDSIEEKFILLVQSNILRYLRDLTLVFPILLFQIVDFVA